MKRGEEGKYYSSVIVLNAGGTINMGGGKEKKPQNKVFEMVNKLKRKLASKGIDIEIKDIFERPPDSTNIGEKEWQIILNEVKEVVKKKEEIGLQMRKNGVMYEKGGIVITHGTDTMEITSFILSLELALEDIKFPIIFTGSHSSIDDPGSDALNNLAKAIIAARERFVRTPENLPPGVYVIIGRDIHLATRLTKVYSQPDSYGKYFFSHPAPVGQINGTDPNANIKIDFDYLGLLNKSSVIDYLRKFHQKGKRGPYGIVEHIIVDKFTSPTKLLDFRNRYYYYKSLSHNKSRRYGLIIQGDFSRNSKFSDIVNIIKELSAMGILVFVGSKKVYNNILKLKDIPNLGLIHKSMSHSKARTKLLWLLSFPLENSEIIGIMNSNISGEIINIDNLPEWINYETFPNQQKGIEVIVVYPNIDHKVFKDAVRRLSGINTQKKRKTLYIYGFGDGHIPTINSSIANIVSDFIKSRFGINLNISNNDLSIDDIIKIVSNNILINRRFRHGIIHYLIQRYNINKSRFTYIAKKHLISKASKTKFRDILESLMNLIKEVEREHKVKIRIEGLDAINKLSDGQKFKQCIKIQLSQEIVKSYFHQAENKIYHILNNTSHNFDQFESITLEFPEFVAKRIIKDALMESSDILRVLGNATDTGIRVHVKSQAVRTKTDTSKYEVGMMLQSVGVDSDAQEGWDVSYFKPQTLSM